jgi:phage shock protein C
MKKLYRSTTNKHFTGLIGGVGEYLNIDPTLLRLVWVAIVLFTGVIPGLLIYFVGTLIVPARG